MPKRRNVGQSCAPLAVRRTMHRCMASCARVPGVSGSATTAVEWDPDGDGPQDKLIVVGGGFEIAGDTAARNVAAWDGVRWHALGAGVNGPVRSLTVYQ